MSTTFENIQIDDLDYRLEISRKIESSLETPRLIIAAYQKNEEAHLLLRACIKSLIKNTDHPYELWIIDRSTNRKYQQWLLAQPCNVVLMKTQPFMKEHRGLAQKLKNRFKMKWRYDDDDFIDGSYANGVQLQIASQLVPEETKWLMTLQMDILFPAKHWLSFLMSKMTTNMAAVGVRLEIGRGEPFFPHSLGCLINWQLLRDTNEIFLPDLPKWDVSHKALATLMEKGYSTWCCSNTINDPGIIDNIPSIYQNIHIDRTVDDQNQIIFLHLGRGIVKSWGKHDKEGQTTPREWLQFAVNHLGIDL